MDRDVYIENRPLEEALETFLNRLEAVGYFQTASETIKVLESLGRITSSPVSARRSSPHYAASAMDGIAVKASTTYGASETQPIFLQPDQYIEVDTGDYVSREYDAVIMIEDVNFVQEQAQLIKAAVPWQHIRSVGEDLVAQDMIITSGMSIGPYELASLITAAVPEINAVKKPVVAIIPTGTELVEKGSEEMAPGEIVESNSRMLSALCREWGADVIRHDIVIDDKHLLREAVQQVKDQSDMIVICSGSSAGREDFSSSIIAEFGEVLIHGIATRPGKPAILGVIDDKPAIGVPGYPISAQLVFHLFARPVLYKKQGLIPPQPEVLECSISKKLASSMGVDEFVYVNAAKVNQQYIAYPLSRGAGVTTSLVKSDGVVCIKRGNEGLQAGDKCLVELNHPREMIDRTVVCIGSHDISIDFLADIMQKQHGKRLISTNVGSMGGIMSLARGETHFSGLHLLDYETGDYNISYLKKYLPNQPWLLVNLVYREQGLIVKKGNPLNITGFNDLMRDEVRYINRQRGAGTRVLLDYLLEKEQLDKSRINGYNREEYTHLAVAASVKNDACDCGLGIYASAKALDLDFIPVAEERYDLCILPAVMSEDTIAALLEATNCSKFKHQAERFGGYSLRQTGSIIEQHVV